MSDPNAAGGATPSSKALDRERVEHVAKLAYLTLTPAEADAFASELAAIVRYVDELSEVDTSDVPPTSSVHVGQAGAAALRADEVRPSLPNEVALDQAPRKENGSFAVPAFVEG